MSGRCPSLGEEKPVFLFIEYSACRCVSFNKVYILKAIKEKNQH